MDINEIISRKTKEVLDTQLESIVKEKIEKALDSVLDDIFGRYSSPFIKTMKALARKVFKIDLKVVKLETYNERIIKIIQLELEKFMDEKAANLVKNRLQEDFTILQKQEWKLSEIIEKFVEDNWDKEQDSEFEPTIILEDSDRSGYKYIYIDEDSDQERYNCRFMFALDSKNKCWRYSIGDQVGKEQPITNSFSKLLFALYANAATVEIDEYETTWSSDY